VKDNSVVALTAMDVIKRYYSNRVKIEEIKSSQKIRGW
jgi:hypothetical protein